MDAYAEYGIEKLHGIYHGPTKWAKILVKRNLLVLGERRSVPRA
jgi:hypothetical protein